MVGIGRSQLRSHAFHASCSSSAAKPGSSLQRTGTQRLLPKAIGAGSGTPSSGGNGAEAAGGGGAEGKGGKGGRGVELQAASIATIAATPRKRCMLLILLEALLALVVLVGIVWWTMFSGRPKGELPKDDPDRKD
jgi:cobalamin biosynthesis Mg chelatase CobN